MKFLIALACLTIAGWTRADELPTPVILDTDIGTDVDDAYALVLAARSKQIDLRGVVTWNGKVAERSAIAKKLLQLCGRDDVPVASGRETARDGHKPFWGGWEGKGLLDDGEQVAGVSPLSAVELMTDLIEKSDRPVTIASVGGVANVADLLERSPHLKPKIARLVLMGGALRPVKIENAILPSRLETNLHNDVDAARLVLTSGIPITLTPAEVTFRTKLFHEDYDRIRADADPLSQAMTRMTDVWSPLLKGYLKMLGVKSYFDDGVVMLHDPLAVLTIIDLGAATIEKTNIRIETSAGAIATIADPNGPIALDLVTDADLKRLSNAVTEAVLSD